MKEESLDKTQQKYATARIEIQVASVLMHAWSEVEHDLVYKPLSGTLSEEELLPVRHLAGQGQKSCIRSLHNSCPKD